MRKATAEDVADLLGLVEEYLAAGRPRKAPGKPRPEAINMFGEPIRAKNDSTFFLIDKVSLVGAFKIALGEQGYNRTVREWGIISFILDGGYYREFIHQGGKKRGQSKLYDVLQAIDDKTEDTRQLRRDIRRARKAVERRYIK